VTPLARQNPRAYSGLALATAGAGRRKPVESTWRISAIVPALFFYVGTLYDGERCGATFGLAGVQVDRHFLPPYRSPPSP